jgi:predicted alpha/beta superfamily hydrolase
MLKKIMLFFLLIFMIQNGFGQENSASTQVSTFTIEAPQLKTTKKIWVYLPKNYKSSKKNFPVMYMHDAQNVFDAKTSFAGEWNVDETLDSLNAEVIVIAIEHGNEKRMEELTPYKNEKYGGGNADHYLDFIVSTLKPYVDKNYRTKISAKNTTIAGSSLGGLISYYATLKYPQLFGKAIVFSPSFWFTNDIYTLTEKTKKVNAKIYFLCGDSESDDMVKDLNSMTQLLSSKIKKPTQITSKIVKGGQHNEKLWREAFGKAYLWTLN